MLVSLFFGIFFVAPERKVKSNGHCRLSIAIYIVVNGKTGSQVSAECRVGFCIPYNGVESGATGWEFQNQGKDGFQRYWKEPFDSGCSVTCRLLLLLSSASIICCPLLVSLLFTFVTC